MGRPPKYAFEKRLSDNLDFIVQTLFGKRNKMDRLSDIILISSIINFIAAVLLRIGR